MSMESLTSPKEASSNVSGLRATDFQIRSPYALSRGHPEPRPVILLRHPIVITIDEWYRNIHLLCIGYGSRPYLSSRLTLGISLAQETLGFRRRSFSLLSRYSCQHSHLCTVHGRLSFRFILYTKLPYHSCESAASVLCFSPVNCRRMSTRPVSCYALFKCMAASKPTSWLSGQTHILYHLT